MAQVKHQKPILAAVYTLNCGLLNKFYLNQDTSIGREEPTLKRDSETYLIINDTGNTVTFHSALNKNLHRRSGVVPHHLDCR
jgi:hypothetical protein